MKEGMMDSQEKQVNSEGKSAESKDLRAEYFQLAEETADELRELFNASDEDDESTMEEAWAKDPAIRQMMAGENPSERLKAAQEVKISLLGMLGNAAKLRRFMLSSPKFKRLAEISDQWEQEREEDEARLKIEK